jgi:hypothetical protein
VKIKGVGILVGWAAVLWKAGGKEDDLLLF